VGDDGSVDIGVRDVVLRSRFGQVLVVLLAAVAVAATGGALLRGDVGLLAHLVPALALVVVGAWALFWRPAVGITPVEVELVNILRTVSVTWPAITDVETRWALTLVTADGRYTAWAAPRQSSFRAGADEPRRMYASPAAAASGSLGSLNPGTGAGNLAATLVLTQWRQYRDAGLLGAIEGEGVTTRWHSRTAAVLLLLLLLTAGSFAIP
jgi:hypothetical protein